MLDGYSVPTTRSRLMEFGSRLAQPLEMIGRVNRCIGGLLQATPKLAATLPKGESDGFFPRDPTRNEMASTLTAFAARNLQLLCVFSGEWETYRYEGQLRDAFGNVEFGPNLTERLFDTADHLYLTRPERTAMMNTVTTWLQERF